MGAPIQITFFVDEHLPVREIRNILEGRGRIVTPVQIAFPDRAILATAEQTGGIIGTADRWFLKELFRFPVGHPQCFLEAGVIQVAGD